MADNFDEQKIKLTFDTNAKAAAKDTNALGASIEDVTDATQKNNKATEQSEQAYQSFKTQLREANAELQRSIQMYGESADETVKAAKAVAELKDQMEFAQELSKQFNPDQKFKALGAATQIAGTGLQGVTAGMALFGDQSEDTEKALLKVQSAMAFSDAISQLSDLGDQWQLLKTAVTSSSIATKANSAATGAAAIVQNVFTGSVNASSTGFKVLKGAIAGTGIGLLVVGLVALIQNFDKVKKAVYDFVPGLKTAGEFIGNVVQSITDFIGVTSESERAIDRMKSNADKSLALNKKFLEEHGSQLDEYTKAKIEAVNEYHELIKEDGANQVALFKELNRKLANIDKERQDEIDKKRKEAADKAAKDAEDARKKREEEAKKAADAEKKRFEDWLKQIHQEYEDQLAAQQEFLDEQTRAKDELQTKDEDRRDKDNANEMDHANNMAAFKKTISDQELKDKETKHQAEKEIQDSELNLAEQAVGVAKIFGEKSKGIQKAALIADSAIGIAKVVQNVETANAEALANPANELTFGAYAATRIPINIASGALSIASNIAATAKALQALGGGSASSGGANLSSSTRSGGGGSSPTVAFSNSAQNQIGQSIAKSNVDNPPIKAVVLESDITTAQSNVIQLKTKNTFP